MTNPSTIRFIRQLASRLASGQSDCDLLAQFCYANEQNAFTTLVYRHGPMVRDVCSRMLRRTHDAEDAFQATFLVLVRRAKHLCGQQRPIGPWLHGVAYRIAVRLRAQDSSRARREVGGRSVDVMAPRQDLLDVDLLDALHQEIIRLPEKYRHPVLLCYLQGRTNAEAARHLQWPVGTVKARLSRARDLLQRRLTRRGMAPAVGVVTMLARKPLLQSTSLFDSTVQAAGHLAAGGDSLPGFFSERVIAIAKGVSVSMLRSRTFVAAAWVLAIGLAGATAMCGFLVASDGQQQAPGGVVPNGQLPLGDLRAKFDPSQLLGNWSCVRSVSNGKSLPVAAVEPLRMTVTAREIRLLRGEEVLLEGKYELQVNARSVWIDITPPGAARAAKDADTILALMLPALENLVMKETMVRNIVAELALIETQLAQLRLIISNVSVPEYADLVVKRDSLSKLLERVKREMRTKIETHMREAATGAATDNKAVDAAQGILELEGDLLKLAYTLPAKKRPTTFSSELGSGIWFGEWRRIKP